MTNPRFMYLNLRCLQISTSLLGGYFLASFWSSGITEDGAIGAALIALALAAGVGMYLLDQKK